MYKRLFNMSLGLILLFFLCFIIARPGIMDEIVLLEKKRPAFWSLSENIKFFESKNDDYDYARIKASKDGFGNVDYNDFCLCIRLVKSIFPQAKWTTIVFFDETGIEIAENNPTKALYGSVQEDGKVKYARKVELDLPLDIQIEGVTTLKREYNIQNHLSYEMKFRGSDPIKMPGGYYAIAQKWDDNSLIERKYLDLSGNPIERTDGYASVVWKKNNGFWSTHFNNLIGEEISSKGINLVKSEEGASSEWSEWIRPKYNTVNSTYNIGQVILGDKKKGDVYSCQIELEFCGITPTKVAQFLFRTQGAQDGMWENGNVWNNNLINLSQPLDDGIYKFTSTTIINEDMVKVSNFDIGFRCDNWNNGSFRFRKIKIEKNDSASEWTPGI